MKPLPLIGALLAFSPLAAAEPPAVRLIPLQDRVRVELNGQLFTEYIYDDGASRSYFYPILASDGTPLTRNYPMKRVAGEETDHPWHRSMWFAHSMVNGVDFWNEGGGDAGKSPAAKGHTAVIGRPDLTSGGPVGRIQIRDRWLDPAEKTVCTDDRIIEFSSDGAGRWIDFTVTLHALADRPLLIGDNKDGTMAIRVAEWMTMAHKVKGVRTGGDGHIVTSTGAIDGAAWGQRAEWCEYHADLSGKTYGVAIFDHPDNLRHPTWWMARDYGLFGANPFGQHDYENLRDRPHIGDYTVPAGGSVTLHYRFFFHLGDEKAAGIASEYAAFAGH